MGGTLHFESFTPTSYECNSKKLCQNERFDTASLQNSVGAMHKAAVAHAPSVNIQDFG